MKHFNVLPGTRGPDPSSPSGAARWLARYPHVTRLPLALEIALALTIKISLLVLLWYAFFSTPQTRKMRLPTPQVEQHLLKPVAAAPHAEAPDSTFLSKARDATHR